jgi:hypothetical protein
MTSRSPCVSSPETDSSVNSSPELDQAERTPACRNALQQRNRQDFGVAEVGLGVRRVPPLGHKGMGFQEFVHKAVDHEHSVSQRTPRRAGGLLGWAVSKTASGA